MESKDQYKGKTAIVIDDEHLVCEYCSHCLKLLGFTVIKFHDGKDAIQYMACNSPDLILTDLVMPETEGIETITIIRKSDNKVKIIAMSGSIHNQNYLSMAKQLGANEILYKPFMELELEKVVVKLFQK